MKIPLLHRLHALFGQQQSTPVDRAIPSSPRQQHKLPADSAELMLHSRSARRLLEGRQGDERHARIIGLYGFAKMVRQLEQRAQHGSHKARHILGSIAAEITAVADILAQHKAEIRAQLEAETRIHFAPYQDEEAEPMQFAFVSHLTWQVLDLLATYDDILCLVIPYQRAKIIDKKQYQRIEGLATHLRRVLAMPEQLQRG